MTNFQLTEQRVFAVRKMAFNEPKDLTVYLLIGTDDDLTMYEWIAEPVGLAYGRRTYRILMSDCDGPKGNTITVQESWLQRKLNDDVTLSYVPQEGTIELKLREGLKLYVSPHLLMDDDN